MDCLRSLSFWGSAQICYKTATSHSSHGIAQCRHAKCSERLVQTGIWYTWRHILNVGGLPGVPQDCLRGTGLPSSPLGTMSQNPTCITTCVGLKLLMVAALAVTNLNALLAFRLPLATSRDLKNNDKRKHENSYETIHNRFVSYVTKIGNLNSLTHITTGVTMKAEGICSKTHWG